MFRLGPAPPQETRKSLRLETQLQQLQAESVAQQSELAELQAAQAVAKQETQAMQALRGERVLLLQKEAQLKADAEEGTRRQRRLEHEKEEMAAELEALRGAQAQQLADLDRQRHQLAELRAKVGDHTLEKSQVEDKYGEMQAKHQKAVADLQSLQKQTQVCAPLALGVSSLVCLFDECARTRTRTRTWGRGCVPMPALEPLRCELCSARLLRFVAAGHGGLASGEVLFVAVPARHNPNWLCGADCGGRAVWGGVCNLMPRCRASHRMSVQRRDA